MVAHRARTESVTRAAGRRVKVAALYLQHKTQQEIAAAVGVHQATVSRDLDAVREEWLRLSAAEYGTRKAEELARIDHLEAEAWRAWERSQKPAETETEKTTENSPDADGTRPEPGPVERTRRREGRDGDPEFLRVVQWCIARRCAIVGLDSPKQFQFTGNVVVTPPADPPPGLSPDELATLADLAVRAGVLDTPPNRPA